MIKECKRKIIKELKGSKMTMKMKKRLMKKKMSIQMTGLLYIPMRKLKKRLRVRTKRRRKIRMLLLDLRAMISNRMKTMTMMMDTTMTTKRTPSSTTRIQQIITTTCETITTLSFIVSRELSRHNQRSSLISKTNGCSQQSVDHEFNIPMQFSNSSIS